MQAVVCYYSWHGHTTEAGKAIANAVHGQEVAVVEVKKRRGLFGWLAGGRDAMRGRDTPIQPLNVNWNAYDTVFIGSPIWGSATAPAVNSLIQQAELAGKRVYVFATSGGELKQEVLDKFAAAVTAKGATVVGRFSAVSTNTQPGDIARLAREWAEKL